MDKWTYENFRFLRLPLDSTPKTGARRKPGTGRVAGRLRVAAFAHNLAAISWSISGRTKSNKQLTWRERVEVEITS